MELCGNQSVLHNDRDDLLQFFYQQLSKKLHRDDYKEYLELAIIFLGGTVPNFSFKRPGAMCGVSKGSALRLRLTGSTA